MKQVAITGGAGYIGGQTAIYFKEQGWEVTVVDRHNLPERLAPFVDRFLHDEFQNEDALKQYASVDSIIHCAGSSLVGPSIKNPSQY
jgi:UDP-glucose 4-epimerase